MLRFIFRLLIVVAVIISLLLLFRPGFIANAGNGLLDALNGSNATGAAQIVPATQGSGGTLLVNLQGLASNIPYVITLDEGQCGGKVLKTFGKVTPNSNGSVSGDFSFSDVQTTLQQGIWIDVHQGNSASGTTVACGQVNINDLLLKRTPSADTSSSSTTSSTTTGSSSTTTTTTTTTSTSNTTVTGFPQTGVAPGNGYDNYTFPRKY